MRAIVCAVVCGLPLPAAAQERTRFVERTPLPHHPAPHTMARAGNPDTVSRHAVPGVGPHDYGGYVGGRAPSFGLLHRNPAVTTGPITEGTFGTDFGGFRGRTGRVFLTPSAEPAAGHSQAAGYRTDGHYPPDVFALRPLRKAILEKRHDAEERRHGHK